MRTAFTDRTLRLRDEICKGVLTGEGATVTKDAVKDCQDCECYSCKPYDRAAAGLPTALMPGKRVSKPRGGSTGKKLDSNHVGTAIHKMFVDDPEGRPERLTEEVMLGKQFGRRSRASSADPRAAGGYNVVVGGVSPTRRGRMDWQPQIWDRPPRSQMAMTISPAKEDAPPSLKITSMAKGEGEFKTPSGEAEILSIKWNQPLYRFEVCAGEAYRHPRASSLPPPRRRNPVNNDGVQVEDCDLGASGRGDRKTRGTGNDSTNMYCVTNLQIGKEASEKERTMRLQHDKRFADVCAITTETMGKQAQIHSDIIQRNHHTFSGNMADTLTWN
jgi:hypothetical protein